MIVLDASLAGPLCIPDEQPDLDRAAFHRLLVDGFQVPAHWHIEVASLLRSAMRRQRLTIEQRDGALDLLRGLPVTVDEASWEEAWRGAVVLSDRLELTPYDAAYLELAQRRSADLATRDQVLIRAAHQLGVATFDLRP